MNAILKLDPPSRADTHAWLCRHAAHPSPNGEWLARMLGSWCVGEGALPDFLGLEPRAFEAMLGHFFPGVKIGGKAVSGRTVDFSRMLERQDLINYLRRRAAFPDSPESAWLADILVAGCLGDDHLWQDLGLWSRQELSGLIAYNFPPLAALNTRDMKWKKFIYKQLCEEEGIYVCRAPSCEVCSDYSKCFGPEE